MGLNAAEQEAERRYPTDRLPNPRLTAFVAGAEWAWENPPEHIRELLEAAGEYRDADADDSDGYAWENFWLTSKQAQAVTRLLAAAAALPGDS